MQMTECESSHIRAYGYDHTTYTLALKFDTGIYHYSPVAINTFNDFKDAESKGKFLHRVIRPVCGEGVKQESAEVF